MGRWEPNTRGRLAQAALELGVAKGWEQATVADIAAEVGVTERTFFRYFPTKTDAIFPDPTMMLARLGQVVAAALTSGSSAQTAALSAIQELAGIVSMEPRRFLLNEQLVPTDPLLSARGARRQELIAETISHALMDAGVSALEAMIAAATALCTWRIAKKEWADAPDARTLPEVVAATIALTRALVHDTA